MKKPATKQNAKLLAELAAVGHFRGRPHLQKLTQGEPSTSGGVKQQGKVLTLTELK